MTEHDAVEAILNRAVPAGEAVCWPLPAELARSPAIENRNRFARKFARCDAAEVARRYVYHSIEEVRRLVALAERYALPRPLEGVGIELGAGTGVLASVVARRPAVRAVLGVEICEMVARLLMPKIARAVLHRQAGKVVPVIGSFDDLRLPDGSVDFIVEIDSLHHSGDLPLTVAESCRVLKPGGTLLCFDRCHPDWLTDAEVQTMLARTYPPDFLRENGYPAGVVLTRRDNGEHEYRLFEWRAAFERAGLVLERVVEFRPRLKLRHAMRGLLEFARRRPEARRPKYRPAMPWQYLREQWGAETHLEAGTRYVVAPKRTTVLALRKGVSAGQPARAA